MADQEPIVPDTVVPEEDSAINVNVEDSLASLRSSILDYRRENGRTYHKLSDGKYILPNDEVEQERLDLVNHLFLLTLEGRTTLCPKADGAKRVLDLGTGTGIWALDYADAHPDAEVIGVDLSPIQPQFVPPNCSFEIDDLEKEWTWSKPFDYIHARSMIGSFANWAAIMKNAYDHLEPGGYFEIQDNNFPIRCDDGTLKPDSPLLMWTNYLIEATDKLGRPLNITPKFKEMMEEAGFVDVVSHRFRYPQCTWAKDPKMKELGSWALAGGLDSLEALSLAPFTRVLGWTAEEVNVFLVGVRKDMKNTAIHAYWDFYVVHGRKPGGEETNTE